MNSNPNDGSNNRLPDNMFPNEIFQLIAELGQQVGSPLASASSLQLNSEPNPDAQVDSQQVGSLQGDPGPYGIDGMVIRGGSGDSMSNIYAEMRRLWNNADSESLDISGNSIIPTILSTDSVRIPTISRMHTRRAASLFDSDVNRDYQNFIANLFNRGLPLGSGDMNSILNTSLLDPSQNIYKTVISEKGEDQIKLLKFKADEFPEQVSCPMTLMDFKEGEEIAKLPCGHIFENEPIRKWLRDEDSRCPVCRKQLDSKEIKKDIKLRPRTQVNRRVTPRDIFSQLVNQRLYQEEESELQRAIIASLREVQNNGDND